MQEKSKIETAKNPMDIQSRLSELIPATRVHTRLIDRIAYANDASYFHLVPRAIVQPASIEEIRALFKFTRQHRIPMTFRAGGTSLSGQAVTDGILVDISKHWGNYRIEENARLIRTQPGIVGGFLNKVLRPHGRRIGPDPASIDACMIGGILANNSSGMCCGVTENAYQTLHSMTMVLPNDLVLNTADPDAAAQLHEGAPEIEKGLLELKRRLLSSASGRTLRGESETLAERVRRRYQMKNNNGYLLNAFLDFETPLDILTHLLIGSEGTLGFIAEAVLHTLPDYPRRYTGQLYFRTLQDAANAVFPLQQSGVRAAEIMDRAALRSVENNPGVSSILRSLPEGATAILVEYQAADSETIRMFRNKAEQVLKQIRLLHDPEFTDDPMEQAGLWKIRKGIIPSIGSMRAPGTVSINEDVVFPVSDLADAVTDLQKLFVDFDYPDGAVFGHAKDGNLHFLINQAFDSDLDVAHYGRFMQAMVEIVSGKYDGALKAEHGTGRNTAPFVATEWGEEAYAIMRDLKSLLDPDNMLNPGVVINPDPKAHITHVKSMRLVAPGVDKCIECGFCESKCPSRRLTLTPRQRIVVQREIARLTALDADSAEAGSLKEDFGYAGIDTCAADGLCATACPVGINTGSFVKQLRAETVKNETLAVRIAEHFAVAENAIGWSVRVGHMAEGVIGVDGVRSISLAAERITGTTLPKWNHSIPISDPKISRSWKHHRLEPLDSKRFVYFASCISRQLGTPKNDSQSSNEEHLSLMQALVAVATRAGISLQVPSDTAGHCCGMPFASKGYITAYRLALHNTLHRMWKWSEGGKHPIVVDTTSCTCTLRTCTGDLNGEDHELWRRLTFLDAIEFLHDCILPELHIDPLDEDVVLHPNCSARRLGLDSKMLSIAERCAQSATIPFHLGCCAFAGDRGLLFPELTASATEKEAAEVLSGEYQGHYSSNIPCEIGMSEATGMNYMSIIYLVERASRTR